MENMTGYHGETELVTLSASARVEPTQYSAEPQPPTEVLVEWSTVVGQIKIGTRGQRSNLTRKMRSSPRYSYCIKISKQSDNF